MSVRKKPKEINLLPVDKFAATTAGRIFRWLLTTFRYIVIIVEMIVMVAFLSRFWLDAKNSDLNEEIKQKEARIKVSQKTEEKMRNTQKKLRAFSTLASPKILPSDLLEKIPPLIPEEATLNSISISPEGIIISGNSFTELGVLQTLANLGTVWGTKKVHLQNISINKENNALKFTINIDI